MMIMIMMMMMAAAAGTTPLANLQCFEESCSGDDKQDKNYGLNGFLRLWNPLVCIKPDQKRERPRLLRVHIIFGCIESFVYPH
jgi:hypothetical protein